MRVRTLPLVREHTDRWRPCMAVMVGVLAERVYAPLFQILGEKPDEYANARYDVLRAIQEGRIQYTDGRFEGRFSAGLSRELQALGATWDRKNDAWKLPPSRLTPDVSGAIGASVTRFKALAEKLDYTLAQVAPQAAHFRLERLVDSSAWTVNHEFEKSVRQVTVAPTFTDEQRGRIAREYTRNMQLGIVDWTNDEVKHLRLQVSRAFAGGARRELLARAIEHSYGMAQNKALFLARQETTLLASKIKQVRYQEVGLEKYRWVCVKGSPGHEVRPMHKKLNNTIQLWSRPPIVNEKGERKHPGCDWNCRCGAHAVVEF